MTIWQKRLLWIGAATILSGLALWAGLLSPASMGELYDRVQALKQANLLLAFLAFLVIYTICVALLVIPPSAPLSLISGLLFGTAGGTLLCVMAKTIGGLVSFFFWRHTLAVKDPDALEHSEAMRRAGPVARAILTRKTALTLLAFRLSPLPYGVVTMGAATAGFGPWRYTFISILGQIPASFIYASLGAQIARQISAGSLPDFADMVRDPGLTAPFIGLALLSLLAMVVDRFYVARLARAQGSV